jgi:hypothetical protein
VTSPDPAHPLAWLEPHAARRRALGLHRELLARTPGLTWTRDNPHVAATGEPSSRIDYILVGLPPAPATTLVINARLIGDQPRDGLWPSDHAGVAADLHLPTRSFAPQPTESADPGPHHGSSPRCC